MPQIDVSEQQILDALDRLSPKGRREAVRRLIAGASAPRRVQPPTEGPVVAFPELGGLHHRYERRAA